MLLVLPYGPLIPSKMMINHYFVDRFFVFALFREPNSTNAVSRAHEILCEHENTIQQVDTRMNHIMCYL